MNLFSFGIIFPFLLIFCCEISAVEETGQKSSDVTSPILKLEIKDGVLLVKVKIGSDPQTYKLVVGTSFTGIWIVSQTAFKRRNECFVKRIVRSWTGGRIFRDKAKAYNDKNLPKEKKLGTFEMACIDGTVKGYKVEETVVVESVNLQQQKIGIATDLPDSIERKILSNSFHGYFGISHSTTKDDEMLKYLLKDFPRKCFGLYLNFKEGKGEIFLGGIDAAKIEGGESSLKEAPVDISDDGWVITIESISIGDQPPLQTNLKALLDLSTNIFAGKKESIIKINSALKTKGNGEEEDLWDFTHCNAAREAPKIVMTINKEQYTLESSDYIIESSVGKDSERQSKGNTNKSTAATVSACFSGFIYKKSLDNYDLILGTQFFNKYYTVFDVENKKIRFGKRITTSP